MEEEWREIKGYEGLYEVSNMGRIRGMDREQWASGALAPFKYIKKSEIRTIFANKRNGYNQINLCKNSIHKTLRVCRLVAIAFLPNPENKEQVNHIDCNKLNDAVSNLEWATRSENQIHAFKNGLISRAGTKNSRCKLTEKEVFEILDLIKEGIPTKVISNRFNIKYSAIYRIRNGDSWNHLTKVKDEKKTTL